MSSRSTLGASYVFEGIGVHSGERSSVRVSPLAEDAGICFAFGDTRFSIRDARYAETRRRTSIAFPGGQILGTVEHLLASLVGLGIDDALIEARPGSEIPILDGSALPFAERFAEDVTEKNEPAKFTDLPAPVCVEDGASSLVALPSRELRIIYVIDYPGTSVGTEMKDVTITPESFMRDVAPARTFGLESEVEALRLAGLARGASADNAITIDSRSGKPAYRLENECAAHKILDLLGDSALAGSPIRAHYICVRGGHDLHSRLVNRLRVYA
ncbi:MAG: UDP-3-O-acyl-N-acetylglucosamine deacetylase [Synergistaceae bacterium]|jgi:UDP-3-O-[3-hydroxymyristoyl] N-acetylglucosamine deacetylase|nr:UDP-3-O-acyl-N-acetylglucosamine deacetylase [Synergistaceae bacterium]